jgi:PTS system ascorbate-specific IIA component
MVSVLIVAHSPLASALQVAAEHVYAEKCRGVGCVDIEPGTSIEDATQQVSAAMAALGDGPVLVLVDTFGATPCNAALAAADARASQARVVAGVNVPMLWRTLCYADVPIEDLVTRAIAGATHGVMQVSIPRRQNQPVPPLPNDQAAHQHHQ